MSRVLSAVWWGCDLGHARYLLTPRSWGSVGRAGPGIAAWYTAVTALGPGRECDGNRPGLEWRAAVQTVILSHATPCHPGSGLLSLPLTSNLQSSGEF